MLSASLNISFLPSRLSCGQGLASFRPFVQYRNLEITVQSVLFFLQEVGCDGIVGSSHKLDKCGVCMGDGSTCRTVSGIFTRPQLSPGYTKIITIPAGSTNINITELRQSKNYLGNFPILILVMGSWNAL